MNLLIINLLSVCDMCIPQLKNLSITYSIIFSADRVFPKAVFLRLTVVAVLQVL